VLVQRKPSRSCRDQRRDDVLAGGAEGGSLGWSKGGIFEEPAAKGEACHRLA